MKKKRICAMLLASVLTVFQISAFGGTLAAGPAEVFAASGNLVTNGNAESGSTAGWRTQGSVWEAAKDVSGVTPHSGTYFFWPTQTDEAFMYQDVDISGAKTGDIFRLSAYMRDYTESHGDESELAIQMLDANGKRLAQDKATVTKTDIWTQKTVSLAKTSDAKTVRVILHAKRNVGTDCDAYFDDVELVNAGTSGSTEPGKTEPGRETETGKTTGGKVSAFSKIQGESFDSSKSKSVQAASEGEQGNLGYIVNGSYACFSGVDFGDGAESLSMYTSKPNALKYVVEIRLNSPSGTLVGSYTSPESDKTSAWSDFKNVTVPLTKNVKGVFDLYFVFSSSSTSYLMDIDYFTFTAAGGSTPGGQNGGSLGSGGTSLKDFPLPSKYKSGDRFTSGKGLKYKVESNNYAVVCLYYVPEDLEEVYIPATVTLDDGTVFMVYRVREETFRNCRNLKEVHFGPNVCDIRSNCFINCPKLKSIYIYDEAIKVNTGKSPKIYSAIFNGIDPNATVYVPQPVKKSMENYVSLFYKGMTVKSFEDEHIRESAYTR